MSAALTDNAGDARSMEQDPAQRYEEDRLQQRVAPQRPIEATLHRGDVVRLRWGAGMHRLTSGI